MSPFTRGWCWGFIFGTMVGTTIVIGIVAMVLSTSPKKTSHIEGESHVVELRRK